MFRRKHLGSRGFTLVELMIVVAIIGVLAALAIYGVRRYLASAKTSEAKNTIGAISRGAQGAYEREQQASQLLAATGGTGAALSHDLCGSSNLVPAAVPLGRKDQPVQSVFDAEVAGNDPTNGFKCLKFSLTNPVYYQYGYMSDPVGATTGLGAGSAAAPGALTTLEPLPGDGYWAFANGDLDGDGSQSAFGIVGAVDTASKSVRVGTQVYISEEYE